MTIRVQPDRRSVAVAPIAVSQHTASAHGFKNERAFLDFVREHKVRHVRDGKTVLVMVADLEAALRALAVTSDDKLSALVDDEQPTSADDVLRGLGLKRVS